MGQHILNLSLGCQCRKCRSDANTASAGIVRKPRLTPEEKLKIQELHAEGKNYSEIGRIIGRPHSTINRIFNLELREKNRQVNAKWTEANRERTHANQRRWAKFDHGKESWTATQHARRAAKHNMSGYVDLPDHPDADASGMVFYDMLEQQGGKLQEGDMEHYTFAGVNERMKELKKEAIRLEKETGIKHHIDHLVALLSEDYVSVHHPVNLKVVTEEYNLSKGNSDVDADIEEFCRNIFNIK